MAVIIIKGQTETYLQGKFILISQNIVWIAKFDLFFTLISSQQVLKRNLSFKIEKDQTVKLFLKKNFKKANFLCSTYSLW